MRSSAHLGSKISVVVGLNLLGLHASEIRLLRTKMHLSTTSAHLRSVVSGDLFTDGTLGLELTSGGSAMSEKRLLRLHDNFKLINILPSFFKKINN